MTAFKVYFSGGVIDVVHFVTGSKPQDVRKDLIEGGGYHPDIIVVQQPNPIP